ncbi:MAG: DUF3822 family protein [Ginsengibacter sp.]
MLQYNNNWKVLKPAFEIRNDEFNPANCDLICEVSNDGFSYLVKDDIENTVVALGVYHFNPNVHGNCNIIFNKIFEDQGLLIYDFKKTCIVYSVPVSVLIPFHLYDSNRNAKVLNLIHGDLSGNNVILTDMIIEKKTYNIYGVPVDLIAEIGRRFPSAVSGHQYTGLMKNLAAGENKLSVIFYPQKIVLMLAKDGNLQLLNTFFYKTPEDISYTLLNICRQFEIKNIPVEVSGLIEKDSALFKEIYKYFEEVNLSQPPQGIAFSENMAIFPSHYFSHFFAQASCE